MFPKAIVLAVMMAAAMSPTVTSAQRLERSHVASAPSALSEHQPAEIRMRSDSIHRPHAAKMVLAGIAAGAAGMFAGGYVGYQVEVAQGCSDDWFCGLGGAILGGLAGESLGMAFGVHTAGGRRGSFGAQAMTALGVSALGLVTAPFTGGATIIAIPVVQLVTIISQERKARR